MQEIQEETYTREDRTMLIEVKTTLNFLVGEFKQLKDNLVGRVEKLENCKIDGEDMDKIYATRTTGWQDFEKRIKRLELWRYWIIGVFSIIGVVITLVIYTYFNDINHLKELIENHDIKTNNLLK